MRETRITSLGIALAMAGQGQAHSGDCGHMASTVQQMGASQWLGEVHESSSAPRGQVWHAAEHFYFKCLRFFSFMFLEFCFFFSFV